MSREPEVKVTYFPIYGGDGVTVRDLRVTVDGRSFVVIDPVAALASGGFETDFIGDNPDLLGSVLRNAADFLRNMSKPPRGTWAGVLEAISAAALSDAAPPQPEEPTGLGAVVEADFSTSEGKGFGPAHWSKAGDGSWVCLTDGHARTGTAWPFLTNVRVLSEGVTS